MKRISKADRAVFTEFYDTDDTARAFAKAKLESGTAAMTPESLDYMRLVNERRRTEQARVDAMAETIAADIEKAKAADAG